MLISVIAEYNAVGNSKLAHGFGSFSFVVRGSFAFDLSDGFVSRNNDNELISECFCVSEVEFMASVEIVKCPEGYNDFSFLLSLVHGVRLWESRLCLV